jgi:hypothetical protein
MERLSDSSSSSSLPGAGSSDHSVLVNVVGFQAAGPEQQPYPAASTAQHTGDQPRTWQWKVVNYILIPACLPLLAAYWLLALLMGLLASCMVWPSLLLAQRLYWACPFIPFIWQSPAVRSKVGVLGSWLLRLQFEGAHCTTVISRLLTLPMRPHLPAFYLLGFPVS